MAKYIEWEEIDGSTPSTNQRQYLLAKGYPTESINKMTYEYAFAEIALIREIELLPHHGSFTYGDHFIHKLELFRYDVDLREEDY